MNYLSGKERFSILAATCGTILSGILVVAHAPSTLTFFVTAVSLGLLAMTVGDATEHLSERLSPGATGVLQSALGNLPELFVGIFSLRAHLAEVVQAALVGSILANNLLVLGLAFVAGGMRHGRQVFNSLTTRTIAALMLLAVAALIVPTLAIKLGTPAAGHSEALSIACAIILLGVFVISLPSAIRAGTGAGSPPSRSAVLTDEDAKAWPFALAIAVLVAAAVCAALVSDWFVTALQPAIKVLHMSKAFAGLIVVALAGNAVENLVGVQLMARNKADHAVSLILNSPLQIALGLTPLLVILSYFIGGQHLTLVLNPMLIAVLFLSTLVTTVVVYDGESVWLEGVALIALYLIIATAFWWGMSP
jgi:Ca2+:H+ antiporter